MTNRTWLIAWIGAADHECAEDKLGSDLGPIATALLGEKRYDRIYLLTNYDFDRSMEFHVPRFMPQHVMPTQTVGLVRPAIGAQSQKSISTRKHKRNRINQHN